MITHLTRTAATTAVYFEGRQHPSEAMNINLINGLQAALMASFQGWLTSHPKIGWLASHPLLAAGLFLFCLFLFWGLLSAIARLTEDLWLFIVRLPLRFVQWLFGLIAKGLKVPAARVNIGRIPTKANPDRLNQILTRLEAIHKEQDELMQELSKLLAKEKSLAGRAIANRYYDNPP